MTREIKFRAKVLDEKIGGLVYFDLSEIGNWYASCDVFYANGIACLISSIQQFTGLLDRHGKEIYEGDIVKAPRGNYTVEYFYNTDFDWEELKIIGNIYEQPELLSSNNN